MIGLDAQRATATATRPLLRQVGLPVAILVVVTVVDLATGPDTVYYPFLLLAPTLAAATARPLAILAIGSVSLPLRYWLASEDGYQNTELFQVSTWIYVMATGLAMYLSAARLRYERSLVALSQVAVAAQRAILLPPPDGLGGVRLAVRYFAMADEAELGGDLYLALDTPHGMRMIIGDVLGKGLGAVRTASITIGAFREAAYNQPELADVARLIDESIVRNAPAEQFVTALLVEVRDGEVEFLHRGHEQPVLIGADGGVRVLEPPDPGLPLGLTELAAANGSEAWAVPFGGRDLLVLVTDGVADARNADGCDYLLVERITKLLGGTAYVHDPAVAVERLGDDLSRHVGWLPFTDDALIIALARAAAGPAGDGHAPAGDGHAPTGDGHAPEGGPGH
ncbi:PP2C family protein-serine/threonine phosphatase [Yinghuangia seranimata]|uniref:PP2C family protein-serine/threonine phosphatase n=1 Tax=Yinghuangia seranimata TaxID=408067 RepID=UPI00248CD657|nr:PP2C family protein-serine/threonine phosphatase [Yinghuangia seranimata]MDI2125940.1 PP2C family protein-serine/threonine phosphatase [Yinghuangia seranimata]